jgi:NADH-quinone oxidoreductase subunit M
MNLLGLIMLLLAGGGVAWISGRLHPSAPRWVAVLTLLLGSGMVLNFWLVPEQPGIYSELSLPWIERFGISVLLVMDGLSLMLVALTLLLGLVAVASSWTEIAERTGFFQFNLLWTLAGVVGVFTALDLFLFFFFWEVMLIPMYFLIAVWGHENRGYAAMKFFLFTQISGLLLLVAIVALVYANYSTSGVLTFSYYELLGANIAAEPSSLSSPACRFTPGFLMLTRRPPPQVA